MEPGPVQMASALTETFYDLNTSTIHPVYPQPTYPAPPPLPLASQAPAPAATSLWSPRHEEGYCGGGGGGGGGGGEVGSFFPDEGVPGHDDVTSGAEVTSANAAGVVTGRGEELGHGGDTPVAGEWAEEEEEGEEENGGKDGDRMGDNSCHKHSQVAATLTWLTDNYERAEGVCLPRCVLYAHYLDFCKKHDFTPAGAATFGKIIRQKFPKLTTRRLGTRGQSKYHYYGIGIKETSVYYHSVYSGRGLTRFSGVKVKTEGSNRKYSLSSKTGTLLPEFPDVDNFILPDDVSSDKMQTLLMMYRTHCQRILDTIISANFDEVQNLLLHFWQGMPTHLIDVLSADILCDIVALCDSILYKVLADVLLPSVIQDMPDSLGTEIKVLARKLPVWLHSALDSVPLCLAERKMEAARNFTRSVTRQLSFVHLAQTARSTLSNQEEMAQMTSDLDQLDFYQVLCRAFCILPSSSQEHRDLIMSFFGEFHSLLLKQAPVESYTEWIDSVVDTCVLQPCKEKGQGFRESAADFLMQWTLFGSLLMKDLTLLNCRSFGSFHLLHMMLDEYVYLVMETQRDQSREMHLQRLVQRHMRNAEAIKTQAKVRTGANKIAATSPKTRKRKQEDQPDSTDEMEMTPQTQDPRPDGGLLMGREGTCLVEAPPSSNPAYHQPLPCTAFTRPPPSSGPRDALIFSQPEADSVERSAALGSGATYPPLPVSPIKALHGVAPPAPSFVDRASYLSQFGLNSYPDFVASHNPAMAPPVSSRSAQSYTDAAAHAHGQAFPSALPFSPTAGGGGGGGGGGGLTGGYWGDGRSHHHHHHHHHHLPVLGAAAAADPYAQYGAHGVTSAYDSYKNAALLRGSVYGQEAAALGLNSAARGYFGARASDTYQTSPLAVGSAYGGSFMEIAPSGAQYSRHPDSLPAAYQDDLYTASMPATLPAFHKHYLASSFR